MPDFSNVKLQFKFDQIIENLQSRNLIPSTWPDQISSTSPRLDLIISRIFERAKKEGWLSEINTDDDNERILKCSTCLERFVKDVHTALKARGKGEKSWFGNYTDKDLYELDKVMHDFRKNNLSLIYDAKLLTQLDKYDLRSTRAELHRISEQLQQTSKNISNAEKYRDTLIQEIEQTCKSIGVEWSKECHSTTLAADIKVAISRNLDPAAFVLFDWIQLLSRPTTYSLLTYFEEFVQYQQSLNVVMSTISGLQKQINKTIDGTDNGFSLRFLRHCIDLIDEPWSYEDILGTIKSMRTVHDSNFKDQVTDAAIETTDLDNWSSLIETVESSDTHSSSDNVKGQTSSSENVNEQLTIVDILMNGDHRIRLVMELQQLVAFATARLQELLDPSHALFFDTAIAAPTQITSQNESQLRNELKEVSELVTQLTCPKRTNQVDIVSSNELQTRYSNNLLKLQSKLQGSRNKIQRYENRLMQLSGEQDTFNQAIQALSKTIQLLKSHTESALSDVLKGATVTLKAC